MSDRPLSLLSDENQDVPKVLTRQQCEAISLRALSFSKADETRVDIRSTLRADTRFAVNQVSTSGTDGNTVVRIRSVFGNRVAQMTTNKLDDASLAEVVKNAEALARITPEDPEYMEMLGQQPYRDQHVSRDYVPTAAERAAAVKNVTNRARAAHCFASGYLEVAVGATAMATSRGLFGYQRTGGTTMTTTVRTPDGTGSGWAGVDVAEWGDLDAGALGAEATEKAERSRNPVAIEPGRYTIVLEPTATANLVQLVGFALDARSADEGRSFFSKQGGGNKIGLKVVSDQITLESDPADLRDALFDAEGQPAQRTVWIENGVVRNLLYDRFWAKKQGKVPTAVGGLTLRMSGGAATLPSLIASTERGVLVTRFWYIRAVDPRTLLYTGLTRDGTFLIEDGKITKSIKNMRYNDSPIFLLNNVDLMGRPVRVSSSEDGSPGAAVIMPAIRARDFLFSSSTDSV